MKAAVATNVTVGLEGIDCTLCLAPLKPPVFQFSFHHTPSSISLSSSFWVRIRCSGGECGGVLGGRGGVDVVVGNESRPIACS